MCLCFLVFFTTFLATAVASVPGAGLGPAAEKLPVVNLDGGGSASSLFTGAWFSGGIALDPATGKVYWTDRNADAIVVGNLDGSGTPQNLIPGENNPTGLAIDPAGGKARGGASGAEVEIRIGHLWTVRDGRITRLEVFPAREDARKAAERAERS